MFNLIITVKRGSACSVRDAWLGYPTLAAARLGAAEVQRDDRVQRVMIVGSALPPAFIEWADR